MKELSVGQSFKNYKELCTYLDEPILYGNSKSAQMKNWERFFKTEKTGHQIKITEVYTVKNFTVDKRCTKIDSMIYYLRLMTGNFPKGYQTFGFWLSDGLWLINRNVANVAYSNLNQFCEDNGILDYKVVRPYIQLLKSELKSQFLGALEYMAKRGFCDYRKGYRIYYRINDDGKTGYVETDKINDIIINNETIICNDMNEKYKISNKMKGRQLVGTIENKADRRPEFNERKYNMLMGNESALQILNDELFERFGNDGFYHVDASHPIIGYNEVLEVTRLDGMPPEEVDPDDVKKYGLEIVKKITKKCRPIMSNRHWMRWDAKIYWPFRSSESQLSLDFLDDILWCYREDGYEGYFTEMGSPEKPSCVDMIERKSWEEKIAEVAEEINADKSAVDGVTNRSVVDVEKSTVGGMSTERIDLDTADNQAVIEEPENPFDVITPADEYRMLHSAKLAEIEKEEPQWSSRKCELQESLFEWQEPVSERENPQSDSLWKSSDCALESEPPKLKTDLSVIDSDGNDTTQEPPKEPELPFDLVDQWSPYVDYFKQQLGKLPDNIIDIDGSVFSKVIIIKTGKHGDFNSYNSYKIPVPDDDELLKLLPW